MSTEETQTELAAEDLTDELAKKYDPERLLRMVWGTDYYGDSRTIDVHVAWLRDKLGDSSVKIQTVWGVGYKLIVEENAREPQS